MGFICAGEGLVAFRLVGFPLCVARVLGLDALLCFYSCVGVTCFVIYWLCIHCVGFVFGLWWMCLLTFSCDCLLVLFVWVFDVSLTSSCAAFVSLVVSVLVCLWFFWVLV